MLSSTSLSIVVAYTCLQKSSWCQSLNSFIITPVRCTIPATSTVACSLCGVALAIITMYTAFSKSYCSCAVAGGMPPIYGKGESTCPHMLFFQNVETVFAPKMGRDFAQEACRVLGSTAQTEGPAFLVHDMMVDVADC